jgi:hypothetical protein
MENNTAETKPLNKSITNRMLRAAKLDVNLYEEVEADTTANGQAFTVVFIVSLLAGIGSGISGLISSDKGIISFLWGLLIGLGASLVGWLLWALIVYWIGITFFKTKETEADYGQLLRTLGFAATPSILGFFVFIPILGGLLLIAGFIWRLVAGVIAVRQAMDFSTWRAIGSCLVGLIPYLVLNAVLSALVFGGDFLF